MASTTRRRSPVMPEPRATLGQRARDRARRKMHEWTHPHRCDACDRSFRKVRGPFGLNAHHAGVHVQRWTSAKARKAARAMGKDVDRARRRFLGALEERGLREVRDGKVVRTPKDLSRPGPKPGRRGRTSLRQMRKMHRHDKHHDRAERHERVAGKTRMPGRKARLERKARDLRGRWPERSAPPVRIVPLRPPPARPAPNGNGTKPAPAPRTRPSRTGRTTR